MNKLFIIGNLTKAPELRTTTDGRSVCNFSVAVNRRKKIQGQPDADFFRVSAWNALGENCAKYLQKGKKVSVIGAVSVRPYTNGNGEAAANMEVIADEVEFLSSRQDTDNGYTRVDTDECPY